MKNCIYKRFQNFIVILIMTVCIIFSGIGSSYVSAAVPAVTTYALWEMLLLSLGVSVEAEGGAEAFEEICNDFQEAYENWWNLKLTAGAIAISGAAKLAVNLQEYYKDGYLDIPLPVWIGLKAFVNDSVVLESKKLPINGAPDLTECTFETFAAALCYYFEISDASDANVYEFLNNCYQSFIAKPSFLLHKRYISDSNRYRYYYIPLENDYSYYWKERGGSSSADDLYEFRSNYSEKHKNIQQLYINTSTNVSSKSVLSSLYFTNGLEIIALCANGQFYDFYEIFSYPDNLTSSLESGPSYKMSDISSNTVTILSDKVSATINSGTAGSITDAYVNSGYDVLTPGREWDEEEKTVTGNVIIGIPSEDVLEAYRAGDITWNQLLEVLDIHPVDTSTGKDIVTDTTISESIDKLGNQVVTGVNSITIILREVIDTINSGFDRIADNILNGIVSLILPSEGFIEGRIGTIMNRLSGMGIAPFDMSGIFPRGDENPFKDITAVIYGQEVVIVSFAYLDMFLNKFRPVIRGLMALFLVFYNINQFFSLIRLAGVMEGGHVNTVGTSMVWLGAPGSVSPGGDDGRIGQKGALVKR